MFTEAEAAALYDVLNPWDPDGRGDAGFYTPLVMAAGSVLDVGCGTGAMLRTARERGHRGRLAGLDPDRAALERARRRTDVEWAEGGAADAARALGAGPGDGSGGGFELATMTGHAFQCLLTDRDVREALAGVREALRPGGRFAFETRHPGARAWEGWNPSRVYEAVDGSGRALRMWHEVLRHAVDPVAGGLVEFRGTVTAADGTTAHVDHSVLRFLGEAELDGFLAQAGFAVEERYGDWARGPVGADSGEIITLARRA